MGRIIEGFRGFDHGADNHFQVGTLVDELGLVAMKGS
jgi:hypothetical protein